MNMQEDHLDFSHNIYKNDPILFASYVGKQVKITMANDNIHCGIVYTVDPVSESVVLLPAETSTQHNLKIIFGHAIKNIEVTSQWKTIIPELFLSSITKIAQTTVSKRKDSVIQLLLDNRFLVKEEDDILLIEDIVRVEPPYFPENCTCTNSIILSRIQNILMRVNVE